MGLTLPMVTPTVSVEVTVEGVQGIRETTFRVDLLDRFEKLIGTLDGVQPGGSLSWSAQASVKGGGTIDVHDVGQNVDWLNVRLRPVVITADDDRPKVETPLGIFLTAAPVAAWKDTHRSWSVEMLDKSSILDTDIVTDASGNAETYSLDKGANVIDAIKTIIADAGEQSPAILPDDEATLASSMTWEAGDTRLKIVNDLLDAANYFSIWCDGYGQFQATKYQSPADRAPIYRMLAPLSMSDTSLMSPEWSQDHDIYNIPNRLIAIQTGTEDDEGLTAVATNENPDSPYSFQSRGRWITQVETGVEATDQGALDGYAQRNLDAAMGVSSTIEVEHLFLPNLLVNSVIRFNAGDISDSLTSVTNTEVSLDPLAMVKTTLREVVS